MTKYQVSTRDFREAVENGEDFLMAFEDGRIYYQPADSEAKYAEYSMIVEVYMYEDVEIDDSFMRCELMEWQSGFDLSFMDIEVESVA